MVSIALNAENIERITALSSCRPTLGPVDDRLFFKGVGSGSGLRYAAAQHRRIGFLKRVSQYSVPESYGVMEVLRTEHKVRQLSEAEIFEASIGNLIGQPDQEVTYGLLMENINGVTATLLRKVMLPEGSGTPSERYFYGKMGERLRDLASEELHLRLYQSLASLVERLHRSGAAHGDLYHGNIMLRAAGGGFSVVLVDPNAQCGCAEGGCEHFSRNATMDSALVRSYALPFEAYGWGLIPLFTEKEALAMHQPYAEAARHVRRNR